MRKIIDSCQKFYFSNPQFRIRLFKLILISAIPILFWGILTEFIIEDLFQIKIPDIFEQLKKAHIPEIGGHVYIVFLGPIIETLLFQKWTFQIVQWIGKKSNLSNKYGQNLNSKLATFITASAFAGVHYENHYLYPILVLPIGLFLGWIYLSNLTEFNSKSRAFWMTACFHMFNNGMATIIYIVENS